VNEQDLRKLFAIPDHYRFGGLLEDYHYFSFCDSTICVYLNGTAIYTYLDFDGRVIEGKWK
jgi:hypothetical protein